MQIVRAVQAACRISDTQIVIQMGHNKSVTIAA